jgi:flagellar motor component MotA
MKIMSSKIKYSSTILAPISIGELIDKITILEIKQIYMTGIKLKNINKEMKLLKNILQDKNLEINIDLIKNLKKINKTLWEIEDNIRIKESKQEFDEEFIKLARSVYIENDKRASIKKEINQKYNSDLVEEKSYKNY